MPASRPAAGPRTNGAGTVHVVHVFGAMDIGGAELRTLELMERLAGEVRVTYVTLSGRRGSLAGRIEESGGTVRPMALNWGFAPQFWSFLRASSPDIVHSHVATFSGAILGIARAAGVPRRIAHFRSDGDAHGDGVRRRVQRDTMRSLIRQHATDIVGVAPSALSLGYDADWPADSRCRIIPNGLALTDASSLDRDLLRREAGIPAGIPVLVHVGRPSREKNRERLPSIVRALHDSGHPCALVVIGPEHEEWDARLRAAADHARVRDWVWLLGPRPDVQRYVIGADVLVLPSLREGLPGVVLEARACGTPVVASELDGIRYIQSGLGGVTTVPVSAADSEWASAVVSAVGQGPTPVPQARATFARSVFDLTRNVAAARVLYGLATQEEVPSWVDGL